MSTIDLINAIDAGDSEAIEKNFQELMADRVSERLDDKRAELAQSMFKDPEATAEDAVEEDETATEE
jgi:DNA gyrase inhibitor GyrI